VVSWVSDGEKKIM